MSVDEPTPAAPGDAEPDDYLFAHNTTAPAYELVPSSEVASLRRSLADAEAKVAAVDADAQRNFDAAVEAGLRAIADYHGEPFSPTANDPDADDGPARAFLTAALAALAAPGTDEASEEGDDGQAD